jgi:cysteine desulfurase
LFHTDAAQAFGKITLDVEPMNIDLMSISGHKCYAPKGIGALYVRRRPRARLEPQLSGGGQERGLRSGTLPTPLVAGLGEAARIAGKEMDSEAQYIRTLGEMFLTQVTEQVPHACLNGHPDQRWPGVINLSFGGINGQSLLMALKDLAVSSGSACSSGSQETSYVLQALGREGQMADTSVRFGIGRFTTEAEIEAAAGIVIEAVHRLQAESGEDKSPANRL